MQLAYLGRLRVILATIFLFGGRSLANNFIDYAAFLKELPERVQTVLKRFEKKEGIGVRLDNRDLSFLQQQMERIADRRLAEVSLLMLAFLVAAMLMTGVRESATASVLLYAGIGFFLALFLLFLVRAAKEAMKERL